MVRKCSPLMKKRGSTGFESSSVSANRRTGDVATMGRGLSVARRNGSDGYG